MKIIRAHFKDFRILRNLELDFSHSKDRSLTVIRAENESGKTTIMTALQWALYGDQALPNKGREFRLHPIDWDTKTSNRVTPQVDVEIEQTIRHRSNRGTVVSTQRYRIVRTAVEEIDGNSFKRSPSTVEMYALTDEGSDPLSHPDSRIAQFLPNELREVFFTDGDRALSFIEADASTSLKRKRVESAIRALLGLDIIESAIKHVGQAATDINRRVGKLDGSGDITVIAEKLERLENENDGYDTTIVDAEKARGEWEENYLQADNKLTEILKKGDRKELATRLERTRRDRKRLEDLKKGAAREHSLLLRSQSLAQELLAPKLKGAVEILDRLHDQREFPNQSLPVLEERLENQVCICGESLQSGDPDGDRRRSYIESLIQESRQADEIKKILTELFYSSKTLLTTESKKKWLQSYSEVFDKRQGIEQALHERGIEERDLEKQIDTLPETDISELRVQRKTAREEHQRWTRIAERARASRNNLESERLGLITERDRLLKTQNKGNRLLAELEVAQDIQGILERTLDRLKRDELEKVSSKMNELFLRIIGSDPEQTKISIINGAEISPEFDIVVRGPEGRTLNPDRDLNGASRRALTIAFILALTNVSQVEAPNIIDTPLGMTSGHVKRSLLKCAIAESHQLILFLTPSEIEGCEDIIDEFAGTVLTLTNPAHYPVMLVNDPKVSERTVLRCECSHRQSCSLCLRMKPETTSTESTAPQ